MTAPKTAGVAAFFDLDGTLTPLPSLERRLFKKLCAAGAIRSANCLFWLTHAVRLLSRGLSYVRQSNKGYLRNLSSGKTAVFGRQLSDAGQIAFFAAAIETVIWHVRQGHAIVMVSGTLQLLARPAARSLEVTVAAHGLATKVHVRATRLEEAGGRYTGRIVGDAMFGQSKSLAIGQLARRMDWALTRCYAYGDSFSDRWMLESVGRPVAVNPSRALRRLARKRGWPVMEWRRQPKRSAASTASGLGQNALRTTEKTWG